MQLIFNDTKVHVCCGTYSTCTSLGRVEGEECLVIIEEGGYKVFDRAQLLGTATGGGVVSYRSWNAVHVELEVYYKFRC